MRALVSKLELMALGSSMALWVGANALPEDVAIVPEYIAFWNALLLTAALVILAVIARQLWLWLRWRSIAIDLILVVLASLPVTLITEDFRTQVQPAPSEGFLYRGGFGVCGTYVISTDRNLQSGASSYVLQESCIPDGAERHRTYIRTGASPFMRRTDSSPQGVSHDL